MCQGLDKLMQNDSSSHGSFYKSHTPDATFGEVMALGERGTLPHGQNPPHMEAAAQSQIHYNLVYMDMHTHAVTHMMHMYIHSDFWS